MSIPGEQLRGLRGLPWASETAHLPLPLCGFRRDRFSAPTGSSWQPQSQLPSLQVQSQQRWSALPSGYSRLPSAF